jgi:hypothetical protein
VPRCSVSSVSSVSAVVPCYPFWGGQRPWYRRLQACRPPESWLPVSGCPSGPAPYGSPGGDIYRVGALQGATPPSTTAYEVDQPWTAAPRAPLRQRHPYIHPGHPARLVVGALLVEALARWTWGPPRPLPSAQGPRAFEPPRARTPASEPHHSPFPAPAGPVPPFPDSLSSAAPPICPSFAANWRMLRAYWDRLPEPQSSSPLARGGPAPEGKRPHAQGHDEIGLLSSPRLPPAPRRATTRPGARATGVPCWMDGSVAQAHAESPAVSATVRPLPLRCAVIDSTSAHPPRPRGSRASPTSPAQSLPPCHPPHRPSRATDHSHTDSPALAGLESCAQAFRGPNSILGGHNHTYKVGLRRPAGRVLPSPPSLPTGEDNGALAPRHPSGPRARAGPPTTGQVIRSPPMLSTGKGQGTLDSHPGPRSRPQRQRPPVRFIQPTGDGSWTSRDGPRAPVMPVAAP